MPVWINERRVLLTSLCVLLILFSLLSRLALTRPLWDDEVMALSNYPLEGLPALFRPLPRYAQAAPPFFNALSSLIIGLPPLMQRLALLAAVSGLTLLATRTVSGRWWLVAALVVVVAARCWIQLASELKYYGLEMASGALIAGWTIDKARRDRLEARDIAQLAVLVLLGFGGIVISVVAVGVLFLQRALSTSFLARALPRWREVRLLAPFMAFLIGYYLLLRYATSIQMSTYPASYNTTGLRALLSYLDALTRFGGLNSLPLILISIAICALEQNEAANRTLMLLVVLTVALFGALSFVGLYPASEPRHVAWVGGIFVILVCNAALVVEQRWRAGARGRFVLAGVLAAAAVVAVVPAAWRLTKPNVFEITANDRLVAWLERLPPSDVGLWAGGQPVIDVYEHIRPTLRKHRYFGRVNALSVGSKPDPLLREKVVDQYLAQRIEAEREEPGAWGRLMLYTISNDFAAPAASLIAAAPRGRTFYILASHDDLHAADARSVGRAKALFTALTNARCGYATELAVMNAYVIRAVCPN
jgi:hypothetical protein